MAARMEDVTGERDPQDPSDSWRGLHETQTVVFGLTSADRISELQVDVWLPFPRHATGVSNLKNLFPFPSPQPEHPCPNIAGWTPMNQEPKGQRVWTEVSAC